MKATGLALAAVLPMLAVPSSAETSVRIGVGITIGRPPRAAYGYGYGYGRPHADTFRYGYDRGRHEGNRDGFKDGERGHRFELYREGDYRDADKGYKGWMGPRYEYARGYQRGYEEGYRQGFRQGRERCDRRHDHDRYDDDWTYEVPDRRW
jgi:hypothetical protein